jgi:predicted dinucleotide-binding enzyme
MKQTITIVIFSLLLGCSPDSRSEERETIAVIGTGDLGDSFGPRLAALGYRIVYGSRNPATERVKALVTLTGHEATAKAQREAAQQADIVLLAIPWPAMETVAQSLGNLDGKIVIDVSAPWTQGEDGYPESLVETSSAELIQQWNPGAKVVKGLGTMESGIIDDPAAAGGMVTIPVASDHRDAKERVAQIIYELGLDPVDFGPLRMGRHVEALQFIYTIPIFQRRTTKWEFYFRRTHRPCEWVQADWFVSTYDADQLAEMPETEIVPKTCP